MPVQISVPHRRGLDRISKCITRSIPAYVFLEYIGEGVFFMKQSVDDRAAMLGEYIVKNKATVRLAAGKFGVSKSTVHTDAVK